LSGLEVTELKLSEVLEDNETFRFDSEYFKKEFLQNDKLIETFSLGFKKLSDVLKNITGGATPLGADYLEEGIPFLRVQNIMQNYIDDSDLVYISEKDDNELKRSKLIEDDVLLTITGVSYGKSAIVTQKFQSCNINQHSVKMTVKNDKFLPYFISTFLNSKIGKLQSDRNIVGVTRPALDYKAIKKFKLPLISLDVQYFIEKLVKTAYSKLEQSKTLYHEAETLLLQELDLDNWQPPKETAAVKSFSESFSKAGRLDAEFYQPKYDELEKKLNKFDKIAIRDLVKYPVSSGATPKAGGDDYTQSDDGVPFIRAVDLADGEVRIDNFLYIKKSVHMGILKKTQLKRNDILLSIAGTVGRCAIFKHSFEANINQAISILRFDEEIVKRLYVIIFFNSKIGKEYISKYYRLGLQTNLNLEEVCSLQIPIIELTKQEIISSNIQKSFALRRESQRLLELAKQAVETAIEENEETASCLLKNH